MFCYPFCEGLSSEISESNGFKRKIISLYFHLNTHTHKSEHDTLTWKVVQNVYFNQVGVIHHKHSVLF